MKNLHAYLLLSLLLLMCFLLESRVLFIAAACVASTFYFLSTRAALAEGSSLNFVGLFGSLIGFVYFVGTIPVNIGLLLDDGFISGYGFKAYRDYDVPDLVVAATLVLISTILLVEWPKRWQYQKLCNIWSPEEFHGPLNGALIARDNLAIKLFVIVISGMTFYLAATRQLAVDFSPINSPTNHASTTFYFCASLFGPIVPACLTYLGIRDLRAGRMPFLWAALALPMFLVLFVMGRRAMLAAGILAVIALVFFAGLKISRTRWVMMLLGGVVALLVISVPFLNARASGQKMTVFSFASQESVQRASISGRSTNLIFATVMRADLMGELSLVIHRYPLDQVYLGQGMMSQLAVVVPSAIWPDKKIYLIEKMITDESILERANLPGTDIASTPVVYTFADFGWFGPVELLFQTLLYMFILNTIIRVFNSFAAWIISAFAAISLMLQADGSNFSAILFYAIFTLLAVGLTVTLATLLSGMNRRPASYPIASGALRGRTGSS